MTGPVLRLLRLRNATRPVAAVGIGLLLTGCGSASGHAPATTDLSSDVHSIEAADARAATLILLVHLPAGATSVSAAPPGLVKTAAVPAHGLPAIDVPKYWTVPGPPGSVVDYVRSHEPAALLLQNDPAPDEVELASKDKEGCACNLLVVRVVPVGDGSAVRADAVVLWRRP